MLINTFIYKYIKAMPEFACILLKEKANYLDKHILCKINSNPSLSEKFKYILEHKQEIKKETTKNNTKEYFKEYYKKYMIEYYSKNDKYRESQKKMSAVKRERRNLRLTTT
jgi:hypothetical protein